MVILILGFVFVGSKTLRNKLFYSAGTSKILSEEYLLNDKINLVPPDHLSGKRVELLKQIDDYAKKSVNGTGFSTRIYSLIKIRLDAVLKEIPNTKVPKGKVKIWYIYNMGVIIKSEDKTIAIDLGSHDIYSNMADFTKYMDVLLFTHPHGDHLDLSILKEALKNNITVIIPGDKVKFDETNQLVKDPTGEDLVSFIKRRNNIDSSNLISLKPQEPTTIKGVNITAYPSNHMYIPGLNEDPNGISPFPVNWYYINLSGVTILHMGDGDYRFDYTPDFPNKKIDVFITHNNDPNMNDNLFKLVPNAKTILPLHVWELSHGSGIVNYMNYKTILDDHSNSKFIPLIWGESLLF